MLLVSEKVLSYFLEVLQVDIKKVMLFFLMTLLAAANPVQRKNFGTSLGVDTDTILISGFVKEEVNGFSELVFYNLKNQKAEITALPKKYENRNVMALAAHKDPDKFYVVTQLQRGDLDDPQLHLWDSKAKTWEDLATLHCRVFKKYEVKAGEIQLSCKSETEIDKKGVLKTEMKSFTAHDIRAINSQNFSYDKVQVVGALENEIKITLKKDPKKPLILKAEQVL